jgi:aspartate carbamoyltransferase catalytic subunit
MPLSGVSLLDTKHLSHQDLQLIFSRSDLIREPLLASHKLQAWESTTPRRPVVCCLFFEPSTRTRMSFQMAAYRLGLEVLTMELSAGSSLSKGETYADTVLNFAAMKPDLMVVRYGVSPELDGLLPKLGLPVINAGSGTMAHPTQGLLDAYTLLREWGSLQDRRILIFGDVAHSRVAQSNFDLLVRLGAKVGICAPPMYRPAELPTGVTEQFDDLDEGLAWAEAVMGLRIQLERHDSAAQREFAAHEYHLNWGLSVDRLKRLRSDAVILHPGPINHGVEFAPEVMQDRRCRVLEQVTNGVVVRAALLSLLLRLELVSDLTPKSKPESLENSDSQGIDISKGQRSGRA